MRWSHGTGRRIFVNISNHPHKLWSDAQRRAAFETKRCNEIIDIGFPNVPPTANRNDISLLADEVMKQVMELELDGANGAGDDRVVASMCQGESTLSFELVLKLIKKSIYTVAGCSNREVTVNDDGTKTVKFDFVQFRPYNS